MVENVAHTVFRLLQELDKVGPKLSVANAIAILAVAEEEGLAVQEYAERLGWPLTTVSRQLLDVSDTPRAGKDTTLGLLHRRQDPNNLRTFRYTLSPLGKALLFRLGRVLGA